MHYAGFKNNGGLGNNIGFTFNSLHGNIQNILTYVLTKIKVTSKNIHK